jgi:hypothetical protein
MALRLFFGFFAVFVLLCVSRVGWLEPTDFLFSSPAFRSIAGAIFGINIIAGIVLLATLLFRRRFRQVSLIGLAASIFALLILSLGRYGLDSNAHTILRFMMLFLAIFSACWYIFRSTVPKRTPLF